MFEVALFFLIMLFIATCAFFPFGYSMRFFSKPSQQPVVDDKSEPTTDAKPRLPDDATLKRHFRAHLRSEIESTLYPRPADSVLQRHYDALITAELENRLP